MKRQAPRWSMWMVVGVGAVVVGISTGYLLLVGAMERRLEGTAIAQMEGSVGFLANRIRWDVDNLVAGLREAATRCASRGAAADSECAADVDTLRQRFPNLLVATVLVDRGGAICGPMPLRRWRADELAAIRDAQREAGRAGGPSTGVAGRAPRGAKTLFVVAGIPNDAPTRVGTVGVAIDLSQVAGTLLGGVPTHGEGLTFLALEDGRVIGLAGGDRWRPVTSLGDLFGAEWAGLLRGSTQAPGPERAVVRSATATEYGRVVGVVKPVDVPGGAWVLGELMPAGSLVQGVRPVLFGGAVLVAAALAGAVAALAAWKRALTGQTVANHEADRWRGFAQQRQREGRWKELADGCPIPVVCLTGRVVAAANRPAVQSLVDGNLQQLVGRDFLSFAAEGDRELLGRYLEEQRRLGAAREAKAVRLVTAGGRMFVGELAATAMRESDEESICVAWEEVGARRCGGAVLEAVASAVPVALVLTDLSGTLLWANTAAFDRAGVELQRLQGRSLRSLVERSHWRVVLSALARARRGSPANGKVRVVARGGAVLAADFKAIPLRADGATIGVLFLVSEAEAQPEGGQGSPVATREKALAQLSTSLAHRVRNNFQALLGLLDQLAAGEGAGRTLAVARGLVADSVEDLRRFFVAVSRSEVSALRPVRLGPLLDRWLERAMSGVPAHVRVTVRRESLDDRVIADAGQILLWLDVSLSAALSAMGLGGAVEVDLSEGEGPGTVRLAFSDTGSTGEGAPEPGGERLSLRQTSQALAELVAARIGGGTGATSLPGLRSRLWIELPRVRTEAVREEFTATTARGGAVLLADDEEMVRIPLATALRAAGYEVVEARNGLEVVEEVLSGPERFALVVLDLVMPVMDGREALRRLRECAPALPVVVCTGYDPTEDGILAAAGLLVKPFSIEDFLAKVGELTGRQPDAGTNGDSMTQ